MPLFSYSRIDSREPLWSRPERAGGLSGVLGLALLVSTVFLPWLSFLFGSRQQFPPPPFFDQQQEAPELTFRAGDSLFISSAAASLCFFS